MADMAPEFSRPVIADKVSARESVEKITATPAERAALAKRLDLVTLDSLTALVRLRRIRGGQMVRVTGELEAEVVQSCVVTLEPLPAHVRDTFQALFAPAHLVPKDEDELDNLGLDDEADPPEPIENGRIDIGELVAQHLSLALDPYPRKADAERFVHVEDWEGEGEFPDAPNEPPPDMEGADEVESPADDAAAPARDAGEEKPNPFAALAKLRPKT
ncbi:YceD family protein [Nitrospirillum viridazoti]|uniref:DUF177 domain-containing protein n=1 Tax=Nitrospirillum viridazoti CBAmc TaxID=1441467 RepID=A0A248JTN7_9PROT|nr:DUF177 domain-containing protein [Nitrospirillum amazonense]ASG21886.1 hypothetical protein Y958_07220 [Nitrospirillum amazonense CBAmc]TWB34243.1 uncharacterized metal-binding protein YceD (DUF177 family) [Nitrospirillum amazonense]